MAATAISTTRPYRGPRNGWYANKRIFIYIDRATRFYRKKTLAISYTRKTTFIAIHLNATDFTYFLYIGIPGQQQL